MAGRDSRKSSNRWDADGWVDMFARIYGSRNREKEDTQIWLHVVEEMGELAEDIRKGQIKARKNRKGEWEGVVVNVPDVFAWLSTFTERQGSLGDFAWNKFPAVCPYCFAEKDCVCISRMVHLLPEEREEKLKVLRIKNSKHRPRTLRRWQEMFMRIYGNVNAIMSLDAVGFHLVEEAGEVAREIRFGPGNRKLYDEVADVFVWLFAVCNRASKYQDDLIWLHEITWKRFPGKCWRCHARVCKCPELDEYRLGPRAMVS